MNSLSYTRYELLRTFRNRRFFLFAWGFPLVLYYLIATPNRHVHDFGGSGVSAAVYVMVGLASFGAMNAMLSTGARIAAERGAGWNRQLRLTPLSPRAYFRAKVVTAYAMALTTLGLLYIAGATLGVHLGLRDWAAMTLLLLVGLVPFAAIGVLLGHLLTSDSIGPALGGVTALFAFLGGVWFPITSGVMHDIAESLPSYWLVQASRVGVGGRGWSGTGWAVVAAWSAVAAFLAARAYVRDTQRV
jgi:ABC-2 type transport system permease protein